MTKTLDYAELDGFIAQDALGSFVKRMEHDPTFTNRHQAQSVAFDKAAVITYEGELLRNGGGQAQQFFVVKDGIFAISIILPNPLDFLPVVRLFGDVEKAERFLAQLKAHNSAWLLHNGEV